MLLHGGTPSTASAFTAAPLRPRARRRQDDKSPCAPDNRNARDTLTGLPFAVGRKDGSRACAVSLIEPGGKEHDGLVSDLDRRVDGVAS